jgi:hypothetical protein
MEAALNYPRTVTSGLTGIVLPSPFPTTLGGSGSTETTEIPSNALVAVRQRELEQQLTSAGFIGTMHVLRELIEKTTRNVQRLYSQLPDIIVESTDPAQEIFGAIQAFSLSNNRPRDRQIAERLTSLYRDALAEDERILPASLSQFTQFFLNHPDLRFPRITLTPGSTLRARWIHGPGNFVAIEFIGGANVELVAEIPGAVPSIHVSTEPLTNVVAVARRMGGFL